MSLSGILCSLFHIYCPAPAPTPPPVNPPPVSSASRDGILSLAGNSACAAYKWSDRGVAPKGYIKGMALMYARDLCRKDAISGAMTKALGNSSVDALAWYGLKPSLNSLYSLATGLGMRESSGCYWTGYDASAGSETSYEAEAGLFQMSANALGSSAIAKSALTQYSNTNIDCLASVFKEGANCRVQKVVGSGPGAEYQALVKACPAAAVESSLVIMRVLRQHWGPLNRKEAEVVGVCQNLFSQVDSLVASNPGICSQL